MRWHFRYYCEVALFKNDTSGQLFIGVSQNGYISAYDCDGVSQVMGGYAGGQGLDNFKKDSLGYCYAPLPDADYVQTDNTHYSPAAPCSECDEFFEPLVFIETIAQYWRIPPKITCPPLNKTDKLDKQNNERTKTTYHLYRRGYTREKREKNSSSRHEQA